MTRLPRYTGKLFNINRAGYYSAETILY